MKHPLFVILVLSFSLVSCWKESTKTETKPLQKECNNKLNGYTMQQVLVYLGQPQEVKHDTIDSVPVTEFCYSDTLVLQEFCPGSTGFQGEVPELSVFFMDDAVYSVKTNMVRITTVSRPVAPDSFTVVWSIILTVALFAFIMIIVSLGSRISTLETDRYVILNKLQAQSDATKKLTGNCNAIVKELKRMDFRLSNGEKNISDVNIRMGQLLLTLPTVFDSDGNVDLKRVLDGDLLHTDIAKMNLCLKLRTRQIRTVGDLCSCSDIFRHFLVSASTEQKLRKILRSFGVTLSTDYAAYGYPLYSLSERLASVPSEPESALSENSLKQQPEQEPQGEQADVATI